MNLVHQDPGERNSDPTGDLPVSVRESPAKAWVSGGLLQVGGTDCSSTCMGSFEGGHQYLHYLHHSLAQVNGRQGTQLHS